MADDGTYAHVDSDDDGDIDDEDPWQLLERDDVDADVEIARGGRGDDYLIGSDNDEELYGGAGADLVDAAAAARTWPTRATATTSSTPATAPTSSVFCGNGFDRYRADRDNDLIVGCELYMPSEVGYARAARR